MRRLLFVAALLALAVPAMADDKKTDQCFGEKFVINGKYICAEDPGIRNRTPGTPMPVAESVRPRLKLSGNLMVNNLMVTEFNPADYTYQRTSRSQHPETSTGALERQRLGAGATLQWSPDGTFWIEASWQRPESVSVALDTTQRVADYFVRCGTAGTQLCPFRQDDEQTNRHRFTADDFALVLKWDTTPRSRFASILLGGGVHRRYLTDHFDIVTDRRTNFEGYDNTFIRNQITRQSAQSGDEKSAQTRIFFQLDMELYPAGKSRFVGLALSTRVLSDGRKERQHFTDTLLDQNIQLGIEPGFYDVTARLVLRF